MLLLGLYVPERVRDDEAARRFTAFAWRFAIIVGVVVTVAMASGYARWDAQLPDWWALWSWSMLVLTALPEEAVFRGVIQEQIGRYVPGFAVDRDHLCRSAVRSWLTRQVGRSTSSSLHSRASATAGSTRRRAPSRGHSRLTPG